MNSAEEWIEALQLERHPEGGWFREVYRADEVISHAALPDRFSGDRSFSTAIYFLLNQTDFSALHRIQQRQGVTGSRNQGADGVAFLGFIAARIHIEDC